MVIWANSRTPQDILRRPWLIFKVQSQFFFQKQHGIQKRYYELFSHLPCQSLKQIFRSQSTVGKVVKRIEKSVYPFLS